MFEGGGNSSKQSKNRLNIQVQNYNQKWLLNPCLVYFRAI